MGQFDTCLNLTTLIMLSRELLHEMEPFGPWRAPSDLIAPYVGERKRRFVRLFFRADCKVQSVEVPHVPNALRTSVLVLFLNP